MTKINYFSTFEMLNELVTDHGIRVDKLSIII